MLEHKDRSGREPLPLILHDETIYSWCATTHLMSCSQSSAWTGMALLGAAHAVRQHDLPASIAALPLVQGKSPIEALSFLRKHTIAGYYLPFLCKSRQATVGSSISGHVNSHWRRHVSGVSRSRPTDHPLKWCRCCMDNDIATVGRTYWHVEWQFPTSWICAVHGIPLSVARGRSTRWLLPHHLPATELNGSLSEHDTQTSTTLAAVGTALRSIDSVDMTSLRMATLDRLREIGVIHSQTKSSHERISKWFASTPVSTLYSSFSTLHHFVDGEWIPDLLWRKKLDTAVRWVTLWAALEWSSPAQAAQAFQLTANGSSRLQGDQLLLFETAPKFAAPAHVWDAFSKCDSYAEVMACLVVSRGDVVSWLEQDPQLRAQWKQRLKLGRQQECVVRIRELASESPQLTRQELEIRCTAEVKWLRAHAPTTLQMLLKSIPGRAAAQRHLFD